MITAVTRFGMSPTGFPAVARAENSHGVAANCPAQPMLAETAILTIENPNNQ